MFIKSAGFYDALYHFKDYEEASLKLHSIIHTLNPSAKSLLDVGCGTGKHLEYLRKLYAVEGLDINDELLNAARERLPEVSLHLDNMMTFQLNRSFDVVTSLFSSIAYAKSVGNMKSAIRQMAEHLEPGGILIVEPWISPDQYHVGKITANFVDKPDLKIAWMYTSEIEENVSIFDIHYMVGTPEKVTLFTEKHELGMFSREEYMTAFEEAGVEVEYDSEGLFNRGLYIGQKKHHPL